MTGAGPDISPTSSSDRRVQSALIRAAGGSTISFVIMRQGVGTLFLLSLGAGGRAVGVLTALVALSMCAQVAGLPLMHRWGKVRLYQAGRLFSLAPYAALILLAGVAQPGPGWIVAAVAVMAGVEWLRQMGNTSWWPLLQDYTSFDGMGAFFARMRTYMRIIMIFVPLLVGVYLHLFANPSPTAFLPVFLVAATGMWASAYFMRLVPEPPVPTPRASMLLRLRLAGRSQSVRRYVVYIFTTALLLGMVRPFWIVLYKQRGLPDGVIVMLTATIMVGDLLGLHLWGYVVDRHGGRSALGLGMLTRAALGLAWLFLPAAQTPLIVWALAFSLVFGFALAAAQMGQTNAMLRSVPEAYQAEGFTLVMIAMSLGAAAAGLIGGELFEGLSRLAGDGDSVLPVYFAAVQLALVAPWLLSRRFRSHAADTPARRVMAAALRRLFGPG